MEDKKTIIEKGIGGIRRLSAKATYYARLALGKDLSGEAERLASKKARRKLLFSVLFFTLAWLFSLTELYFSATPLGIALFSAARGSNAAFALIGVTLGAFWSAHPIADLTVAALGLFLRLVIWRITPEKGVFGESAAIRMALSATLSFLGAFAAAALEGFAMETVYALVFTVATAPLLTRLFAYATDLPKTQSMLSEPGRLAIIFFLIYALDSHGIFGFSLGLIAGFFITLSVAITNGALRATLIGLCTGLACGLPYAPIFAVAGLCTGLASNLSLTYSVLTSLGIATVMNLYLNGSSGTLAFMGDLFFATLVFLPLARAGLIPQIAFFADEPAELPEMKYVDDVRKKFRQNRLAALSSAFEELSDIFLELSEKSRRPGGYELREASDEVLARYCRKCALNNLCWQREYSETGEAMDRLIEKVQKGEEALAADLPESVNSRCRHMEKILREINNAAADLVERAVKRDKTELFALDYEAMAELLSETASESEEEFEADKALCRKASDALKGLGVVSLGYSAWGVRRKTVLASGVEIASLAVSGGEIRSSLEKATGLALSEPHFDFNGDFVTMRVESIPAITAEVAGATTTKASETVSGDALAVFDGPCGNRFFLVCDGMGSGKTAAVTAKISTVFLEKMLAAGNKKGVVLKMLSNFLRSKSEECHSSVDLLELDMLSSRALFTKCGAAPSFVLHNGNLFKVDSRSVPIGITRDLAVGEIETPVFAGDLIIMMSDGIAPSGEEVFRLTEALADCAALSCKEIAEKVLSLAKRPPLPASEADGSADAEASTPRETAHPPLVTADDCSVLVARILKA